MHRIFKTGTLAIVTGTLAVAGWGCATKGWVEETVGRQGNQIDQRITSIETKVNDDSQKVGTLTGRLDSTDTRVNSLQSSLGDVRETAETARGRADAAFNQAQDANTRLTNLWASRNSRTPVESFDILFRFGRADLTDAGITMLRPVAQELKTNDKLVVELTGYADPTGPADYNVQLSQRRVETVRRFLVDEGVPLWRINAIGMGAVPAPDTPKEKKRRVTVTVASLS